MESMGDILKEMQARVSRILAEQSDGYQANSTKKIHECEKCKDEEGFFVKRPERMLIKGEWQTVEVDKWKDCECVERKRIQRLFRSSRITDEFQKKTFGNFDTTGKPEIIQQAFDAARAYIKAFRDIRNSRQNSIALLGNPGCGKTHLLMAVSNVLLKSGIAVLYFPWVEGFNEIRSNLSLLDDKITKMQNVEVLFIDDMFKGRKEPTELQIEQLFAIINHRYLNNKPILVSSEKDIDDICNIDEGIGSRINQMCKSFRVVLHGDNLNYRLEDGV